MSELAESDSAPSDLPRLRIHHFFVLTTIFSIVMSVDRFLRPSYPNGVIPEISGGISLLLIIQMLSVSVCIAVAVLGLAWRRQGIRFPSEPGHWVALYLAIAWVYGVVNYVTMFLPAFGTVHETMVWVRMVTCLVFHCLAALLWIAAYWTLWTDALPHRLKWQAFAVVATPLRTVKTSCCVKMKNALTHQKNAPLHDATARKWQPAGRQCSSGHQCRVPAPPAAQRALISYPGRTPTSRVAPSKQFG